MAFKRYRRKIKDEDRYSISQEELIDKHFSRLVHLIRDEEKAEQERFKSEVDDKDPQDREKSGKALLFLELSGRHYNPSGQILLSFSYSNGRPLPRYTLDTGDVVCLSGFKTPGHEKPTGTVYEKTRKEITVAFNGRLPAWIGREEKYHLNAAENTTTYQRMYDAVKEAGKARHTRASHLRNIVLGFRRPWIGDPVKPEEVNFFNPDLNDEQKRAVCMAAEAEEVFLLHGPPGTGKTSVLIEIIRQAHLSEETVLVTAPSNAACDHLVESLVRAGESVTRLGHPARMSPEVRDHTLSFKLARHPFAKMIDENQAGLELIFKQRERRRERGAHSYEDEKNAREEINRLKEDIRDLRKQIFHAVWNESDIVVATLHGCADPLIKAKEFDWVIIDEATQGTEPGTWIALLRCGKLILAGDHKQLPPTVHSPKEGKSSLKYTLFERFSEVLPEESKIRLKTQYRMHENIMNFSSKEFYEGVLEAHDSVQSHLLSDNSGVQKNDATAIPMAFLDTAGLGYEEKIDPGTGSRFNEEEGVLVEKEIEKLVKAGVKREEIAVISPYSAQVKLLRGRILSEEEMEKGLGPEINSIDSFQGREKEIVMVSLVRSNLNGEIGFLADTRRMNVAITRAKKKLLVIGDSATISTLPFYDDFIKYVESIGGYLSAWEYHQG
ncbi:MAG: AAA family ATPase [Candidatus Omnitrophica bacterium]|nr:AAA family ATPase [Candidatus Omnitrophota bacterium]